MEQVDTKEVLNKNLDFEREMEARVYMVNAQIDSLERLIETGKEQIRCPSCWNQVASLLDRLRYFVPAIWITAEDSLRSIQINECNMATNFTTGIPAQSSLTDLYDNLK